MMKINFNTKITSKNSLLIFPLFYEDIKVLPKNFPKQVQDFIKNRRKQDKFNAFTNQSHLTYFNDKNFSNKVLLYGFGKEKNFSSRIAREFGAKIGKVVQHYHSTEISIFINPIIEKQLQAFFEGLALVQYKFDHFKANPDKEKNNFTLKEVTFISENKFTKNLEGTLLTVSAVDYVKHLVNSPSNVIDSEYLALEARKIAKENKYKLDILGKKQLQKIKAGGILAVNQASNKDPKLIILQYQGGKKDQKPLVFVGKGVIFDTGGYNLKTSGNIETMHQDMAGAASVLGLFKILKKLGIPENVIGIIPVVENLVNENAYRPSDIITMLSGKTVEVTNTDAEGRIILADAVYYATRFKPQFILTIATLTGAVGIALGDRYAGIMGDPKLSRRLQDSGREVDDLLWPLPIHRDYRKKMNSEIADFRNYDHGTGRLAGTAKGAAFIEKFVEDHKWCHIDIGGTAFTSDPKQYEAKGATAHGLRMLINFLKK